jgi:hypothetical protein
MNNEQRTGLGRRVGRQVLTVVLALITLLCAAALAWASLALPRADLVDLSENSAPVNDLPANLTWLLLIGIAIVAWRQVGVGVVTALGCAAMALIVAFTEIDRYAAAGQSGTVHLLIYLIAFIQAGSFLAVAIATGLFGWRQRVKLHNAVRDGTNGPGL